MKKITFFLLLCWRVSSIIFAQDAPAVTFSNPIIPGFHPDPSICRVGEDYYIVTSSFEWYPGIPIYHSRDLMNWKQIGHVLTRPSQLQLKDGLRHSNGLWAPTVRFHEGKFYVICTAQQAGGNFYVTAEHAEGPYSEPTFLEEAPGIDPSLFFDDDGTCWYTGSINETPETDRYPNEDRIYLQKLDLEQGKLVGERYILTSGHATNAPYCEAPHLYKINHKYYLITAEGGTWENHAVTVFTSDKVTGPYIPGLANPVLTHRHLGNQVDISSIGHADLVQTQHGKWWAVTLGVRPLKGYNMLGRETFLVPVSFENGWPVFNENVGRVLLTERDTGLQYSPIDEVPIRDQFNDSILKPYWSFLRTPFERWHTIKDGKLIINVRPQRIQDLTNPSLIARRIEHFKFEASTMMEFHALAIHEEAGIIVMQNNDNHYRLVQTGENGQNNIIKLMKRENGKEQIIASIPWNSTHCIFKLRADGLDYQFYIGENEDKLLPLGGKQDASVNSTNKAGGFIGPFIGMYASSNNLKSENQAIFEYFDYQPF